MIRLLEQSTGWSKAVVTTTIRLRFDCRSIAVWLRFDCHSPRYDYSTLRSSYSGCCTAA